ncbi:MAG: hypothetical protein H0U98_03450 [Alphaproteobacteria bacterium]|nr:hypothetical protein [Alphaproteobacteria bacterium]
MTLKSNARKTAAALLRPFGMELVRSARDLDDFLEPGKQRDAIFRRVAVVAGDWLQNQSIAPWHQNFDIEHEVREFFGDYLASPFRETSGGSRIGNLLWLDLLAKALAPDVMLDSGTFRGASAWALSRGNPSARVFSFDIDMSQLLLRVPGVDYVESDWTQQDVTGQNMLCYFDDHVDQCRRVREAAKRGVSIAVFDDDYDVSQFAPMAHGGFSLPKLSFCFDESLGDGEVIAWREAGRRYEWTVPKGELDAVRGLVGQYQRLPDISAPFGVDQMPYSIAVLKR